MEKKSKGSSSKNKATEIANPKDGELTTKGPGGGRHFESTLRKKQENAMLTHLETSSRRVIPFGRKQRVAKTAVLITVAHVAGGEEELRCFGGKLENALKKGRAAFLGGDRRRETRGRRTKLALVTAKA